MSFDCINFFGSAISGLWFYYALGNGIYRTNYDLSVTETVDSGDYSYTSQKSDGFVGSAKGKIYFKRHSYDDGYRTLFQWTAAAGYGWFSRIWSLH